MGIKKDEMKEWDDALLDLINRGLVEVVPGEEIGFRLTQKKRSIVIFGEQFSHEQMKN